MAFTVMLNKKQFDCNGQEIITYPQKALNGILFSITSALIISAFNEANIL